MWLIRSQGTRKCLSCRGNSGLRSLEITDRRGTFKVKRSKGPARAKVTADGQGVVSHAGVRLLREMAENTGLVEGVTAALIDTYRGVPILAPGRVFADLAVAVADGADAISGISVLVDRADLFGPVASMPTTWRVLDRIDADHLAGVRAARGTARAGAWAAGAAPDLAGELCIDFDATITIAHSPGEGNRGQDVEEDLRVPSAVGVLGPSRRRRR
jgi:hypothetical protein